MDETFQKQFNASWRDWIIDADNTMATKFRRVYTIEMMEDLARNCHEQ